MSQKVIVPAKLKIKVKLNRVDVTVREIKKNGSDGLGPSLPDNYPIKQLTKIGEMKL